MSTELIIGIVFGGGGGSLFAYLLKTWTTRRRTKIDDNETIILRLVSENERLQVRADREEKRADEAETEADRWRRAYRECSQGK